MTAIFISAVLLCGCCEVAVVIAAVAAVVAAVVAPAQQHFAVGEDHHAVEQIEQSRTRLVDGAADNSVEVARDLLQILDQIHLDEF